MNNSIGAGPRRSVASLLGLLGVLGGWLPSDSHAESTTLGAVLDPLPGARDKKIYQMFQDFFPSATQGGAAGQGEAGNLAQGRSVLYLSPGEASLRALRHNLPLRMSQRDADKVKQAVEEAEAVFSPVFRIGLSRSETFTYKRERTGPVYTKRFYPTPTFGQPYLDIPTAPGNTAPQINRIGYILEQGGTAQKTYPLHKVKEPGPYATHTGSLSVEQQLPWGQQISLSQVTSYEEHYYDPNHGRSWEAPWGMTVNANLLTPVPFGKGFGLLSPLNVNLKQARLRAEKVDWTLRATINDILAQTDLLYWDLVQKVESLVVAVDNLRHIERQVDHARRMLAAGRLTQNGYNQIETEFSRARITVEEGKESLVLASIGLSALIAEETQVVADSLVLPIEYVQRLESQVAVDWHEAVETALKQRPEMQARALDRQASQLDVDFQANQTRPDLVFSVSKTLSQNNDTYGYKDFGSSFSQAFHADNDALNVGFTYTYPWRNRAAKAALAKAKLAEEGSQWSEESQRQQIRKEVYDALTSLSSALALKDTASSRELLAGMALEKGQKRWEIKGDIREVELLIKSRTLLEAGLSRVAAMVSYKQAETQLLAAQGKLAESLAEQSAVNDFDRQRLLVLSASGATPYFSQKEEQADDRPPAAP